eukprot:Gb_12884 [translate_table: standard]
MAEKFDLSVLEEIAGALKLYSDGSVMRAEDDLIHNIPPSDEPSEENDGVSTRDVAFHPNLNGLWVRLYLPDVKRCTARLPVMLYFHGGGFCFLSPAFVGAHRLCLKWAAALGVIIVSVNYRLAPEHRLPAAYDDSLAALEWVRSESIKKRNDEALDPWLNSFADFSNVFLMGDSAGGNIVHHLIMSMGEMQGWNPLQIRGALLLQPFFGGQKRTKSEIECPESALVTSSMCDTFWRLSLPTGANRNHPFSNPFCPESRSLPDAVLPPVLVFVGGKDCLRDRGLEYCQVLRRCGKDVELIEFEEEEHGLKLESESSKKLMEHAGLFVSHCCELKFINGVPV